MNESTLLEDLLRIEKGLWTNNANLYHDSLLPEAKLLFPETGLIDRDTAVHAIRQENEEGRHWAESRLEETKAWMAAADTAILTYRVTARWAHEEKAYTGMAASVYLHTSRGWRLAFHHQSPV